jgi:hypothetical protein
MEEEGDYVEPFNVCDCLHLCSVQVNRVKESTNFLCIISWEYGDKQSPIFSVQACM